MVLPTDNYTANDVRYVIGAPGINPIVFITIGWGINIGTEFDEIQGAVEAAAHYLAELFEEQSETSAYVSRSYSGQRYEILEPPS
jgi:hypothetical protein